MDSIYKIEAYCASSANVVESYIFSMGGRCVVQGSAVITDYGFESHRSLELLPHIALISDQVTDVDLTLWTSLCSRAS